MFILLVNSKIESLYTWTMLARIMHYKGYVEAAQRVSYVLNRIMWKRPNVLMENTHKFFMIPNWRNVKSVKIVIFEDNENKPRIYVTRHKSLFQK